MTGEVSGGTRQLHARHHRDQYSNVGDYPINVTLGSNPNYTVTKTDGTLTISQQAATVTADDKTKTYGDDNPTLTATVTGEVSGGDASTTRSPPRRPSTPTSATTRSPSPSAATPTTR